MSLLIKAPAAAAVVAATKVIAANDAIDKTRADYVSDAVDDEADFQQFITDVGATGGLLECTEGTFTWGTATLTLANKLTFQGRGMGITTLKLANALAAHLLTVDTKEDIVFQDMTFDGNYAGGATGKFLYAKDVTHIRFERCRFQNCNNASAFDFWNGPCPHVQFIDCEFLDFEGVALDLDAAGTMEWLKVINCFFSEIKHHAIIGYNVNLPSARILDNTFYNIGATGYAAVYVTLDHDTQVKGNIAISPSREGFDIRGTIASGLFEGNTVYIPGRDGIKLDGDRFSALGNFVWYGASLYSGIVIKTGSFSLIVNQNMARRCQDNGITIEANCSFLDVCNNQMIDNGQRVDNLATDIQLKDSVTDSRIKDNTIRGTLTNKTKYGIEEQAGCDRNVIKDNIISGPKTSDLLIVGPEDAFDHCIMTEELDLCGGATDIEAYHAASHGQLVGYTILYTEASSAEAGVNIRVGRYQDGVALNDDYFDVTVSEVDKNKGYATFINTAALTATTLAKGDTITIGTAGGKAGTGKVRLMLHIADMAD